MDIIGKKNMLGRWVTTEDSSKRWAFESGVVVKHREDGKELYVRGKKEYSFNDGSASIESWEGWILKSQITDYD